MRTPEGQFVTNSVLDVVNAGLILVGGDRRIAYWNEWMAAASGMPAPRVVGGTLREAFPANSIELIERAVDAALDAGAATLLTHTLHPHLLPLKTRTNLAMLHDVTIGVVGKTGDRQCLIQVDDVTLSVKRDRLLRDRQNARYDALMKSAFDPILTMDDAGAIQLANPAAVQQLGFPESELIGTAAASLFESRSGWEQLWHDVKTGGRANPVELTACCNDGVKRQFEVTASAWQDASRSFVTAILRDVTEQRKAEAALRQSEAESRQNSLALAELNEVLKQSSEALTEAARRKDEFLATLAHELRNPLAPLLNGLNIMRIGAHDANVVVNARTMMERQVTQMVRLIDDLMDLSRINRDAIDLSKELTPLNDIVQQAVESCRPLIEAQQHRLTVDLPTEELLVDADVVRLVQVFVNLLNNAAKYTPKGGEIAIRASRDGRRAVVRIMDNGIGIPSHLLSRVFDMFMQVDPSMERTRGGLGIGLSLVRRLVEMHGGSVVAQSSGTGLGSEFSVYLPVAIRAVPANRQQRNADGEIVVSRRILVADDNEDAAMSLAQILNMEGHDTRTAHDGVAAIDVAENFQPDVVLLDIGMPRMNGYDAARLMRRKPWGHHVFLVALTGWGQPEDRRRSREAGFDAHLVKPVDATALKSLLQSMDDAE